MNKKKESDRLIVRMSSPVVHGKKIETAIQLETLIHEEYPSLIRRKDFERRLIDQWSKKEAKKIMV